MKRIGKAAVLAIAALALCGCDTLMVATGMRTRLDGVPLQAIAATLPGNGGLAPGGKARLSVVAHTVDGRSLATAGTGDGKVLGDSYTYEATIVTVDEDGVVKLPADPRLSEGRTPHVRIRAKGHAAPVGDIDIPVRYDVAFKTSYAGADGFAGTDGLDGSDGSSGATGSFDPNSPAPGGDGGRGGNGWNGGNGGDGFPGPDVSVRVALAPGARPLLRIRTTAAQQDRFYIVDPEGGSLNLRVRGGAGGRAGAGGRGGSGGAGGAGSPPGGSGNPGMAGIDGMAGSGGRAGHVRVEIDPAAAPFLDRLHITNQDGDGRAGPAPEIRTAPVASPW